MRGLVEYVERIWLAPAHIAFGVSRHLRGGVALLTSSHRAWLSNIFHWPRAVLVLGCGSFSDRPPTNALGIGVITSADSVLFTCWTARADGAVGGSLSSGSGGIDVGIRCRRRIPGEINTDAKRRGMDACYRSRNGDFGGTSRCTSGLGAQHRKA